MNFRDGSLSSFPASVDSFPVLSPGDTELSSHFNRYFDACFTLEDYLLGTIGGSLASKYSSEYGSETISGGNLLLSYASSTTTISGAVSSIVFNLTVPAQFGSSPFDDWRFSMGHTVYLDSSSDISGMWANRDWGQGGPLSQMFNWPQFFTVIRPTGGRNYTATVNVIKFGAGGWGSSELYDSFTRTGNAEQQDAGPDWYEQETGRAFTVKKRNFSSGGQGNQAWCLHVSSERGGNPGGGWIYPRNFPDAADMEVEFDTYDWEFSGVGSGKYYNLAGVMLRTSGDITSAAFYGLVLGHATAQGSAQIVKVSGVNLLENYPTNVSENNRPAPDATHATTLAGTAGTVTSLVSGFAIRHSPTGGSTTSLYRFRAEGTTISLKENYNGGGWTTLASVTDATLTSGKMGFWTKSLNGATDRIYCFKDVYCRILDTTALMSVKLNLIYALIGENAKTITVNT